MVQATTPDGIAKWTNTDPTSMVQESQTQGDSVQAAFNKRQRYEFFWPTATERGAQTGMVKGSVGYQVDTDVNYFYDGTAWTPSVVRFFGTQLSSTTNNAGANIPYAVVEDTAAGWSSGVYTVKYGGLYNLFISSKQTTGATYALGVYKNGSAYAFSPNGTTASFTGNTMAMYIPLVIGDTLSIRAVGANFTTVSDSPAHNNFFQLIRIY